MILPIYIYGHPVLKIKGINIEKDYPGLKDIIKNMWDTMYFAHGVGLAAPQIGLSVRLFIIDSTGYYENNQKEKGIKRVFINPQILEEEGEFWSFEEGCLSIPKINADVERKETVKLRYLDESFKEQMEVFDDMNARIIQHEYDHIEGILFIEKIKPVRRKILQRKLEKIKRGIYDASYPVKQ